MGIAYTTAGSLGGVVSGVGLSVIHLGGGGNVDFGQTRFFSMGGLLASEDELYPVRASVVSEMRVFVPTNTLNGDTVVSLRINGTPAGLSLTVPAGATLGFSVTGSISFGENDLVSARIVAAGSSGSLLRPTVTIGFS